MPRQAINYENTIIYKIQHLDDETLLYVGHTTDFTKRKSAHKANLKSTNSKAYNYKVYQMIRDNGGWDMFNMTEIETFSCSDRREAEAEEDKIMREMKTTMNRNRAYLTDADKKQDKRSRNKKYKEEHPEVIKAHAKKYREKTKVEFEETYTMEKHLEKLAKQKIYRDAYKERQKNKSN